MGEPCHLTPGKFRPLARLASLTRLMFALAYFHSAHFAPAQRRLRPDLLVGLDPLLGGLDQPGGRFVNVLWRPWIFSRRDQLLVLLVGPPEHS